MSVHEELRATIAALARPGLGILAADESLPTIAKRFQAVGIKSSEPQRRAYRQLLLSTAGLGDYVAGVILFEETLAQTTDAGEPLPELARRQDIVPGVKVDQGLVPLAHAPGDRVTRGLDGLPERLAGYKAKGARFAKWRAVYTIGPDQPDSLAISSNAEVLARYAAICQEQGVVPIVEPEVLIDGDHAIERCAAVTEAVLHAVFHALWRHRVAPESMLLKPNMVLPGKAHPTPASPEEIAERTVAVLRRTVPAAVPSVNFLSGGQTPRAATVRLNAINAGFPGQPWLLSFSYARALQEPPLALWRGRPEQVGAAQAALLLRARLNALAQRGEYREDMEPA